LVSKDVGRISGQVSEKSIFHKKERVSQRGERESSTTKTLKKPPVRGGFLREKKSANNDRQLWVEEEALNRSA